MPKVILLIEDNPGDIESTRKALCETSREVPVQMARDGKTTKEVTGSGATATSKNQLFTRQLRERSSRWSSTGSS